MQTKLIYSTAILALIAGIASPELKEKLQFNTDRQAEIEKYLQDLQLLQKWDTATVSNSKNLKTAKYNRSLLQFRQQARNRMQAITQAKQKFHRKKQLFERDLISESNYEKK